MPHPRSPAGDAGVTRNREGSGHPTVLVPPPPPTALGLSGLSYHMGGGRSNPPSDSIGRQGAALAG